MRRSYWVICAIWAFFAVPIFYYGIPYSEGELIPRFNSVREFLAWLPGTALLLLPAILFPFMRKNGNRDTNLP